MKNTLLILLGIIILAVGGYLLMGRQSPESTVQTQVVANPTGMPSTDTLVEPTQTIVMDAGSFYYSVKEIKAKVGDKVKIIMTSKDMMHDFVIDEFSVKSKLAKAGETVEFEFVVDKAGTYQYYCSVGQHRQNGQVGSLIVE